MVKGQRLDLSNIITHLECWILIQAQNASVAARFRKSSPYSCKRSNQSAASLSYYHCDDRYRYMCNFPAPAGTASRRPGESALSPLPQLQLAAA